MSSSVEGELDRKIGKFNLIKTLGSGGMGKVYLARQQKLDRLVAIKILHKELAADDVFVERFQREARAAGIFQHPNIVSIIDADEDPETGDQYIAFEYIDGPSLEDMVKEKPFEERRALEIMREVAVALDYAESKGIVHRDIKPDNILVGSDGVPKLADLGLAKSFDRGETQVTQEGVIVGTPLYMAPEQALGYETVDIRADLYSLGLCLWRMLTGIIPFDEDGDTSSLHILSRHINEDVPDVRSRNADVSEQAALLIRGMCARERQDRYPSAKALLTEIERILAGREPLGPKGEGDPDKTVTIQPDQIQVGSGAATVVENMGSGVRRQRTSGKNPQWVPEPSGGGGAKKFLAIIILGGAVAAGIYFGRDQFTSDGGTSPVTTAEDGQTDGPVATTDGQAAGQADGQATGQADGTSDGADDGASDGASTAVEIPKSSSVPSPDLGDEAATVAHLEKTSKLLFTKVDEGIEHLGALKLAPGWQKNVSLRHFVQALDKALVLLDADRPEQERESAATQVRDLAFSHKKQVIPNKIALSVDRELALWVKFVRVVELLRVAMADPRGQRHALKAVEEFPATYQVKDHAKDLIDMANRVDFYARWAHDKKKRIEVERQRRAIVEKLAGTGVGAALKYELLAINSVTNQITHDLQRSFISAMYLVGQSENGAKSKFIAARRRIVPPRASLRNIPALGILVELSEPWKRGQEVMITLNTRHQLKFSKRGYGTKTVRWSKEPAILIEPRRRDILIRMPLSEPGEFRRRFTSSGVSRFTVTQTKVSVKRVIVIRLPSHN